MKLIKHVVRQPFVAATGLAALVHSTWALGTLFAGEQPEGWALLGWLIPALLIAFALDVGQIATSAEIRVYGLTPALGVTFVVFAGATYYLQWLYIAHHMPALELAAGVRPSWAEAAELLRDAAVWIIPALLPLSTLLYTFSGGRAEAAKDAPVQTERCEHTGGAEKTAEIAIFEPVVVEPVLENRVPFGSTVQDGGGGESMPVTRRGRKRTASGNGRVTK